MDLLLVSRCYRGSLSNCVAGATAEHFFAIFEITRDEPLVARYQLEGYGFTMTLNGTGDLQTRLRIENTMYTQV